MMISTLSACSAAQNLAVFLKTRATTEWPYNQKWLQESHALYVSVLETQQQLLPKGHPDLYVTTYSLAELLHAMGDEDAANVLRQEIIDTFDPPPLEGSGSGGGGDGDGNGGDCVDDTQHGEDGQTVGPPNHGGKSLKGT